MENTDVSDKQSVPKIFLTRIKNPVIFFGVLFLAALVLLWIESQKTRYDTEQNKGILVVSDNDKETKTAHRLSFTHLVEGLGVKDATICKPKSTATPPNTNTTDTAPNVVQPKAGSPPFTKEEILCRSASGIKYQEFKNLDELTAAINQSVIQQREDKLKITSG